MSHTPAWPAASFKAWAYSLSVSNYTQLLAHIHSLFLLQTYTRR